MSAYRQILYHIVFRTKGSEKTINQAHSADLYKYIWGIINNKKCLLFRINGKDHLHILSDLHPSVALADYIRDIKVSSTKWIKESGLFPDFKGWGIKYCALTYSYNDRDTIINYIKTSRNITKKRNSMMKSGDFSRSRVLIWTRNGFG
ncbi:MAG: transposase [Bacteroidales bacterium]|nr:transposase [Bacteroidales bacterium]